MVTLMNTAGIISLAAAVLVLGIGCWAIVTIRRLRRLELRFHEAASAVDLALNKRFGVLVKMHETVTAIAGIESGNLAAAVKWQNGVPPSASAKDKETFAAEMDAFARLLAKVAARQPVFRTDALFLDLESALKHTADQTQASRRLYNAVASAANKVIATFPNHLLADALRIEKKSFLEFADMNDPEDAV